MKWHNIAQLLNRCEIEGKEDVWLSGIVHEMEDRKGKREGGISSKVKSTVQAEAIDTDDTVECRQVWTDPWNATGMSHVCP